MYIMHLAAVLFYTAIKYYACVHVYVQAERLREAWDYYDGTVQYIVLSFFWVKMYISEVQAFMVLKLTSWFSNHIQIEFVVCDQILLHSRATVVDNKYHLETIILRAEQVLRTDRRANLKVHTINWRRWGYTCIKVLKL